jgi:hypothetical protein
LEFNGKDPTIYIPIVTLLCNPHTTTSVAVTCATGFPIDNEAHLEYNPEVFRNTKDGCYAENLIFKICQ